MKLGKIVAIGIGGKKVYKAEELTFSDSFYDDENEEPRQSPVKEWDGYDKWLRAQAKQEQK